MAKNIYWRDIVFPGDIVDFTPISIEGVILPAGTTAERPVAPSNGTIRYNTTLLETELYQNGTWSPVYTTGITGEANTGQNLGAGQPVFESKVGVDLRFRSIKAGTNVSITTSPTELTINANTIGENNTASNIGSGTGTIFDSKLGVDLQFKSLQSLTANLSITDNGSVIDFDFPNGIGEINTGVNTGGGIELFRDKLGDNLRFRTILFNPAQLTITQSVPAITIDIADNPVFPGIESITIPVGPTVNEPLPINGMLRYDSSTHELRGVINGAWQTISTSVGTFLPLSGGTMTGDLNLNTSSDLVGGSGSRIIMQNDIVLLSGASIDMSAGGNIIMQAARTVDGRDLSVDGVVIDNLNPTGQFGFLSRVSDPSGFVPRIFEGIADQVSIQNNDGIAGNPKIGIASNPIIPGNSYLRLTTGTTAQRPVSPLNGMVRFNKTILDYEFYFSGNWHTPIMTVSGMITSDLDMGGFNISNTNLVDGRDLMVDGVTIDALTGITDDTGVVVKSGGTLISRLIQSDSSPANRGVKVSNGDGSGVISIGIDITGQPASAVLSGSEEFLINAGSTIVKTTLNNITSYIGVGGLTGELDVSGEYGFVTRIADGSVGDFERRIIKSDIAKKGIVVVNGDGIAGDPKIGFDIMSVPFSSAIENNDQVIIYDDSTGTNYHTSINEIRRKILTAPLRVSVTAHAVTTGVSQVPFTVGSGDFDPDGLFNNATDQFTPPAGTFNIGIYCEADAATIAGKYYLRVRRNGIVEGNTLSIDADGTNTVSGLINDMFIANGTDVFTVEINNTSGAAATINTIRFTAHRIY